MKLVVFVLASIITLSVGAVILRMMTNKPPESEVKEAGKLMAEAKFEKAPGYATEAFQQASAYYDSAMLAWKDQNERFILFRDYRMVSDFAQKSIQFSEESIHRARETILNTENLLDTRLEQTGEMIRRFEESFGHFPIDEEHRDAFARCKLLYSESLQAYQSKDYRKCKLKLDSVEAAVNEISAHYRDRLTDYFEAYPQWEDMAEQSISLSKKNQTQVLIVDKMARELLVYKNGRLLKRYHIELGANWVGDKMQQGDKSTPEGIYKVVDKKENGQTRYHKAFLLDYPNDEDRLRFARNKKSGLVHPDAAIGNLIEIHGSGGKGSDWTDGCIALQDYHMDELYGLCPEGTRVTIVGSIKPLNQLPNFLQ